MSKGQTQNQQDHQWQSTPSRLAILAILLFNFSCGENYHLTLKKSEVAPKPINTANFEITHLNYKRYLDAPTLFSPLEADSSATKGNDAAPIFLIKISRSFESSDKLELFTDPLCTGIPIHTQDPVNPSAVGSDTAEVDLLTRQYTSKVKKKYFAKITDDTGRSVCSGIVDGAQSTLVQHEYAFEPGTVAGSFTDTSGSNRANASLDFDLSSNIYQLLVTKNGSEVPFYRVGYLNSEANSISSSGDQDIFFSKRDSSGNLTWAIQIASSGRDEIFDKYWNESTGELEITGVFLGNTLEIKDALSGTVKSTLLKSNAGSSHAFFYIRISNSGNPIVVRSINPINPGTSILESTGHTATRSSLQKGDNHFSLGLISHNSGGFDLRGSGGTLLKKVIEPAGHKANTALFVFSLSGSLLWGKLFSKESFNGAHFISHAMGKDGRVTMVINQCSVHTQAGKDFAVLSFGATPTSETATETIGVTNQSHCWHQIPVFKNDGTLLFWVRGKVGNVFFDDDHNFYGKKYWSGGATVQQMPAKTNLLDPGGNPTQADLFKLDPNGNALWSRAIDPGGQSGANCDTWEKLNFSQTHILQGCVSNYATWNNQLSDGSDHYSMSKLGGTYQSFFSATNTNSGAVEALYHFTSSDGASTPVFLDGPSVISISLATSATRLDTQINDILGINTAPGGNLATTPPSSPGRYQLLLNPNDYKVKSLHFIEGSEGAISDEPNSSGSHFIAGRSISGADIVVRDQLMNELARLNNKGGSDAFVIKFQESGSFSFVKPFYGSTTDRPSYYTSSASRMRNLTRDQDINFSLKRSPLGELWMIGVSNSSYIRGTNGELYLTGGDASNIFHKIE